MQKLKSADLGMHPLAPTIPWKQLLVDLEVFATAGMQKLQKAKTDREV